MSDHHGAITTIDLAGIHAGAGASLELINGGFLLRGPGGQYSAISWNRLVDFAANQAAHERGAPRLVIANFQFTSSLAGDGSSWGTMLRYANEVSEYRIDAGIGYEHYGEVAALQDCTVGPQGGCTASAPGFGPANPANPAPNVTPGVRALRPCASRRAFLRKGTTFMSILTRTPQQRFLQRANSHRPEFLQISGRSKAVSLETGLALATPRYSRSTVGTPVGALAEDSLRRSARLILQPLRRGAQSVFGVSNTEVTMYGIGIQQNIHTVAPPMRYPVGVSSSGTDFFLDARHFSADSQNWLSAAAEAGVRGFLGSHWWGPREVLISVDRR